MGTRTRLTSPSIHRSAEDACIPNGARLPSSDDRAAPSGFALDQLRVWNSNTKQLVKISIVSEVLSHHHHLEHGCWMRRERASQSAKNRDN